MSRNPWPELPGTANLLLYCIRSLGRDTRNARSNQARATPPDLWALKIMPGLHVFDIEGIPRVGGFVGDYRLKDFGNCGT
jgi:hypothetical protein